MKKILPVVLTILCMLSLVACGGTEETKNSLVLTYDEADIIHVEMAFDAKEDVVTRITQNTTVDLSKFTEDQIAQLEQAADTSKVQFDKIKGVEYSRERKDNKLLEKIVIPTDKETLKAVIDAGLLPVEGNAGQLSVSKSKETMTKSGWKVKE